MTYHILTRHIGVTGPRHWVIARCESGPRIVGRYRTRSAAEWAVLFLAHANEVTG